MARIWRACVLLSVMSLFTFQSYAQLKVWQKQLDGEGEAVGINPLNPNTIYAQGSDNWLRVSRNNGQTWSLVSGSVPYEIREIIVHPKDTLTLFVTSFGNTLERSTDAGASWTTVLSDFGIDGESVTYDPMHPDTMYAGNFANGDLFRSTNRGLNWALRGTIGSNLCALAVRPDSANILLAGSGAGTISKSTNGGITWHQVKSAGSTEIPKIVIDPSNPQVAYGSAFSGSPSALGVWKTTDGGEHWALTSLQGVSIWSLDIERSASGSGVSMPQNTTWKPASRMRARTRSFLAMFRVASQAKRTGTVFAIDTDKARFVERARNPAVQHGLKLDAKHLQTYRQRLLCLMKSINNCLLNLMMPSIVVVFADHHYPAALDFLHHPHLYGPGLHQGVRCGVDDWCGSQPLHRACCSR